MISPNYTTDYFNEGNEVFYVPRYAIKNFADWIDSNSPEWMLKYAKFGKGVVSSTNDKFVFVKYFLNGELSETAQATDPKDLILWKK